MATRLQTKPLAKAARNTAKESPKRGKPRVLLRGERGSWNQNSESLCTKNSQINISFYKIAFFPTMKSGSEGGVLDPPSPIPREMLSC